MTRRGHPMGAEHPCGGVEDALLERVSAFVAETMGLHFPRERLRDLQRGLVSASEELGFQDPAACADWLLSRPPTRKQLQVLAGHLTVGETYFLRDRATLDVFADRLLPDLIRARRGGAQRLRIWSAACCSGEEAYSLAILVREALLDTTGWHITILATDINAGFLRKAIAGTYREWSFRGTPPGFKQRYFKRTVDGRYAILPEIRRMVTFEHLNLVEDVYPSLATDSNAMDVIFCRNALMYFSPAQARKVIGNLHHALIEGGWLAVSPSEASQALFTQFATRNFPAAILYQKSGTRPRVGDTGAAAGQPTSSVYPPAVSGFPAGAPAAHPPSTIMAPRPGSATLAMQPSAPVRPPSYKMAASLYERGLYGEAADLLPELLEQHAPRMETYSLLARALANQGRLTEALTWCDRWIAADKVDASGHYVRGVVLLEQGVQDAARRALQRALYLEPEFVLAHFALGSLARSRGRDEEARKHFANARHLLEGLQPHDILPESDGLTAGRLTETITALTLPRARA